MSLMIEKSHRYSSQPGSLGRCALDHQPHTFGYSLVIRNAKFEVSI